MREVVQISSDFTLSGSDDGIVVLVNASGSNGINIYLPLSLAAHKFLFKRVDQELDDVVVHPRGNDRIESEEAPYHLRSDFSRTTFISSREGDWWALTDSTADGDIETIHFQEIFNLASIAVASPGVSEADAMSYFGQLNVARNTIVSYGHIHRIQAGGSGQTRVELWKGGETGPDTLIGSASLAASDGDFAEAHLVFTGSTDVRQVKKGQYLFAQVTEKETVGNPRGFTFDVHFTGSR